MNLTPEQKARLCIDPALEAAVWILQNRDAINLHAGPGVAVGEARMANGHGFAY
jgi:type I restriction enzyme R subunit